MFEKLILIQLALFIALIVIFVVSFHKARRDKVTQNDLFERFRTEIGDSGWRRIYVSRPEFFRKRLKFLGYEGRGILINHPDHIKIAFVLRDGSLLERSYQKSFLAMEWLGSPNLASANLHWIKLGQGNDSLMVSADTGFNAIQSREETADICRMIDRNFVLPKAALKEFALEANKASLLIVALFFVLIAFAIIDGAILNKHKLISKTMIPWLIPSMLLLAMPCYLLLIKQKVPWRESYALSFLMVIALSSSCIPIIKRLDQVLPNSTSVLYEYKSLGGAKFVSLVSGPPPLEFNNVKEYWEQFEKGSTHSFELIHGPLGLWQLDESDLRKKYKLFYEEFNRNKP